MKQTIPYPLILITILVVVGTAACVPSTPVVPTYVPGAASTSAVETVDTALTQAAAGTPIAAPTDQGTPAADSLLPTATLWSTAAPETAPASTEISPTELPTSTRTPSPMPTITTTPELEISYEDDFQKDRGWAQFAEEGFLAEYSVGRYRIFIDLITADSPVFSVRHQEYRDAVVEVEVLRFEGPTNGYYGLMCRFVDIDNYYRLVFNSEGEFSIGEKEKGTFSVLASGTDPEVYHTEGKNEVRAECIGDTLALYVNGKKLLETKDDTLETGFVGLVAGTPDRPGLNVLFDNFLILTP